MVIAIAGRRVDAEGAETERFPLRNVECVGRRIAEALQRLGATEVFSSAACGVDLLGLEAAAGLRRHVILPFDAARFRETSVADRPGLWGERYDRIMAAVRRDGELVELGLDPGDGLAYLKVSTAIVDAAASRGEPAAALVGWDGSSRGEGDATFAFLELARKRGFQIEEIGTLR
jgi:hypothetical protein